MHRCLPKGSRASFPLDVRLPTVRPLQDDEAGALQVVRVKGHLPRASGSRPSRPSSCRHTCTKDSRNLPESTCERPLLALSLRRAFETLAAVLSELDAKDAEVVEKHRLEAQQAAKRAQDAADEARRRAQLAKDLAAKQAAQQAALRAQYDGSVRRSWPAMSVISTS
jgi:hypothetical protein